MTFRVMNTSAGKKEDFVPLEENRVRMYVCGITAYDFSHIGHARAAVVFDVIYRYLKFMGYDVTYVRNFTDIDDKIINRAFDEEVSTTDLSEKYMEEYHIDMDALGALRPDFEPKATNYITEMIVLIEKLLDGGYAYRAGADVLFSVKRFSGYGKLSGKNIEELKVGARVDVDEKKEDPLDFVLWKGAKPGEPYWESPWGKGRPGWHIECSAMSGNILGKTIDIHGGGRDLVFPHHENEVAQSEAANGVPFVKYWIHNGFVNIDKEKMSKSLGNFLTIRDIRKKYHQEVIRFFLLSNHYRSPVDFSEKNLRDAQEAVERLYYAKSVLVGRATDPDVPGMDDAGLDQLREANDTFFNEFKGAMDDDFNTARAIGKLFDFIHTINRVMGGGVGGLSEEGRAIVDGAMRNLEVVGNVLGLLVREPDVYFEEVRGLKLEGTGIERQEIERLIDKRNKARQERDFSTADEIRDDLATKGVILKDNPAGTTWSLQ